MNAQRSSGLHNTMAGRAIVKELHRLGCAGAVICPGSRSTPLVAAFAHVDALPVRVLHDERSGAFFALGWARATKRPVAIITTSGTAVANLLPAFVEADRDRVPLLALSADRPFECHGTDANQTVNQRTFLQGCARAVLNLPPPEEAGDLDAVVAVVQEAFRATLVPAPGPVQLNCMFRKPLEPEAERVHEPKEQPIATNSTPDTAPAPLVQRTKTTSAAPASVRAVADILQSSKRGLVLLGTTADDDECLGAIQLASFLGWPIASCALSNAAAQRAHAGPDCALVTQASLLAKAESMPAEPDLVLWLGGPTLFPELTQYAAQARFVVRVDPFDRAPGETLQAHMTLATTATQLQTDLAAYGPFPANENIDLWRQLEKIAIATTHDAVFARPESTREIKAGSDRHKLSMPDAPLDEPTIATLAVQSLRDHGAIFVGNSMPIRDVALFSGPRSAPFHIHSNRGASGIDGLVSTAAGIACAGQPLVALLGDLSFLYDVSVWTSLSQMDLALRIIVVENGGGGIFDFLPISSHRDLLDSYFYTPHRVDMRQLMGAYGIACTTVGTRAELWRALKSTPTGLEVIAARSDRAQNVETHQNRYRILRDAIAQSAILHGKDAPQ